MTTGLYTNVHEIASALYSASRAAQRKRRNRQGGEPGLLDPVLTRLRSTGWLEDEKGSPTAEHFLVENSADEGSPKTSSPTHAEKDQVKRVAESITQWIQQEELIDFDLNNHAYFPTTAERVASVNPSTSVTPAEMELAAGEDLELDEEAAEEDDVEPTDRQKREILKIHRGLGHPQPADLARALRRANVKRNIIKWATRRMRCPVCEARVRPTTKRPAALPRCEI